jgi:translocation and assembly module TamA
VRGGIERRFLNNRGHKMNTQLDYAQKRKSLVTSYRIPAFNWLSTAGTPSPPARTTSADRLHRPRNFKLIASRSGEINEHWTAIASINALRERWRYASGTEFTDAVYNTSTLVYLQMVADYVNVDDEMFPRKGISGTATMRAGEVLGSDTSFVQGRAALVHPGG